METTNFSKEILAFNKNVVKMSFDALNAFSDQASATTDFLLGANHLIQEDGKKAISTFFKESKKGLDNLKKNVENGLEVDWAAKDAPAKNLEAMEAICKEAISQAAEIKKETTALVEKATKNLPNEAKTFIDYCNESVNNGFEFFQGYVSKNYELAKKVTADVTVATAAAEAKVKK